MTVQTSNDTGACYETAKFVESSLRERKDGER